MIISFHSTLSCIDMWSFSVDVWANVNFNEREWMVDNRIHARVPLQTSRCVWVIGTRVIREVVSPKSPFLLEWWSGKMFVTRVPCSIYRQFHQSLTLPSRYLPWIQPTEGLWDFNKFLVSFVGLMNILPPPKGILSTGQKQSHNIHILNLVTWKFARLSIYYLYDEQLTRKVWKLPKAVNRLDMRNTSDPHLEVFLGVFTDKSHWL